MSSRTRWLTGLFSVAGAGICASVVVAFLVTIMNNNLPWGPDPGTREHYVAVGQSFSRGFSAGFFLCFFLALTAYLIGTHFERKRREGGTRRPRGAAAVLKRQES